MRSEGLIHVLKHSDFGKPASSDPKVMVAEEKSLPSVPVKSSEAKTKPSAGGFAAAPTESKPETGLVAEGRPGFAKTPYTSPPRLVDVRGFEAGSKARCPFTQKVFLVPGASAEKNSAVAKTETKPKPVPSVGVSKPKPSTAKKEASPKPEAKPQAVAKNLPKPSTPEKPSAAGAGGNVAPQPTSAPKGPPYGSRIIGKAGFANSPFAEKRQIVNVKGIKPGTVVRCPYSGKLFRVPPLLADEASESSVGSTSL